MRQIPLTQGKMALVDDADYEEMARFKWRAHKGGRTWYAQRDAPMVGGKRTSVWMHRQIINALPGQEGDHRDGDGLNNQRYNLRLCGHVQNGQNQHHKQVACSSRYKGVTWDRSRRGGTPGKRRWKNRAFRDQRVGRCVGQGG